MLTAIILWTVVIIILFVWDIAKCAKKEDLSMSTTSNNPDDYSLPRGYRNNNPLNIRISSSAWEGKISPNTDGSFEQFESMGYGFRAAFVLLRNYIDSGYNTIEKIITRWAPENENHTASYIKNVSLHSGIPYYATLQKDDKDKLIKIVYQMAVVENGQEPLLSDINTAWEMI